jgi:MFS family permease
MGWVVYEVTGSGALLGAVLGVRAVPMIALAPLSGVAADRFDRKRLLQTSQLLAAAVSAALGAALALGAVGVWMLFLFTILMGASNVIDRPARFTSAFELVPRELAAKAMALNTIGFSLMRVLGPALAGYLIAAVSAAGTFFILAALYGASALVALAVAIPPPRQTAARTSALADMAEGFRYSLRNPVMRMLLALGALPYLLLVPVWVTLFPIFAKDVFAAGPQGLGVLLTSVGLGGTLGGLIANALAHAERQGLLQAGWIAVMAAAIVGVAASPTLAVAAACAFFGGVAEMALTASNMALLQLSAPEAMRGRIASLMLLYPAMISTGSFLAGPLADLLGPRGAAAALAGAALAALALLYFSSPVIKEIRQR